ncbi:hypothetical protein MSPP1_002892 [Malassezia sp. CBS 17886]|nr:hypothetical protein MSPP1_002892 [Malassezia sp. CBS 17886]
MRRTNSKRGRGAAARGTRCAPTRGRDRRAEPDSDAPGSAGSDSDGPRGPSVFDDAADVVEEDEEIDSDDAFGDDDDEWYAGLHRKSTGGADDADDGDGTADDFEDDNADDLVALSNLLDDAPDDDAPTAGRAPAARGALSEDSDLVLTDAEDAVATDDEDLAALVAQRIGKRTADAAQDTSAKRARTLRDARAEAVPEGTDAAGSGAKLRLEDLTTALTEQRGVSSQVRALGARSAGGAPTASTRGGGVVQAPLPRIAQDRLDRQAAYKQTREEVEGWKATIKRLREAEHLSFPLQKPAQLPAPSNAGLTASFAPTTDMEHSVAALLETGGLTEKHIAAQEGLALNKLDAAEATKRQGELRRMRELMSRMEQKARRANKIKSKTYRRVRRRERERLQQQLAAAGGGDDEEDEDAQLQAARDRAMERATLRHRNTGQWAKSRLGRHDDASADARLALEEQLLRSEQLRHKIHAADASDDDDSDVGLGDEEDDTPAGARAAAFDELEEFAQREAARDRALDADMAVAGSSQKGIFQMKFMKDARERNAREAQATVDTLRDALAQDGDGDLEDDGAGAGAPAVSVGRRVYGNAEAVASAEAAGTTDAHPSPPRNPFASSDAPPSSNPWLVGDATAASARTGRGVAGKDSRASTKAVHRTERHATRGADARAAAQDDATLAIDPHVHLAQRPTEGAVDDDGDATDADDAGDDAADPVDITARKHRGTRGKGRRAVSTLEPPLQQRDLVAEAFAGDNVALEFAREKRAAVRADAPRHEDATLPGWGAWGGKGVRRKKAAPSRVKTTPGLDPAQRKDRAMEHVIINERLDKKAAHYKARDLPYPYTSASQYEAAMRTPLGAEWNTRTQHQRLTLPRVSTKMGQRIDPIQRKF